LELNRNKFNMNNLYALLVGINIYHPDSGVNNLDSCVNDTLKVEKFLINNYKDTYKLNIRMLHNNKATREELISNFENHLVKKPESGDIVLFYYSGHGSYSYSAKEFKATDSKGIDETYVLYDSRCDSKFDLADKEIAHLLSHVKQGVQLIGIIDACHSASSFRSIFRDKSKKIKYIKPRFEEGTESIRPLESYTLHSYYSKQLKVNGSIHIPTTRSGCMLISACDRHEQAIETYENGGIFTDCLIKVMRENKHISYQELYKRLKPEVRNINPAQKPILHAYDGFNPNQIFLSAEIKSEQTRRLLTYEVDKWKIFYGALNGLPFNKRDFNSIDIAVFENITSKNPLEVVKLENVKIDHSIIDFNGKKNESYYVELWNYQSSMEIGLDGLNDNKIQGFLDIYETIDPKYFSIDRHSIHSKYLLFIDNENAILKLRDSNRVIAKIENFNSGIGIKNFVSLLKKIDDWENFKNLNNPNFNLDQQVIVCFEDMTNGQKYENEQLIYLKYDSQKMDYKISLKNNSNQKLYVALYFLDYNYMIDLEYLCTEINAKSDFIILSNNHSLKLSEGIDSEKYQFNIVISTTPFDDSYVTQLPIKIGGIYKDLGKVRGRIKRDGDWNVYPIKVFLENTENKIGHKSFQKSNLNFNINAHPSFEAKLRLYDTSENLLDSVTQNLFDNLLTSKDIDVINLHKKSKSVSNQVQDYVELYEITEETTLDDNPFIFNLNTEPYENDFLIPVTSDGQFIFPFASIQSEGNEIKVAIDTLPTSKVDIKRKSLKKAFWFCILKVAGFREKAFRLRRARFNQKGQVVRDRNAIQSKVDQADKIVILVHGIIGDTKPMAKELMYLQNDKNYDLILTFDYENLNETIENIALEFKNKLDALGLNAQSPKHIDIIAHSLGGLVSRTMIEVHMKGEKVIDNLFMFGTPNGGSPFGSIPETIKRMTILLTVALNYSQHLVPKLAAVLMVLNRLKSNFSKSQFLTTTLGQMNAESDFMVNLFKNEPPETQYHIVGSDVFKYSEADGDMVTFVENVLFKLGNYMSKDESNDIAVLTDQIYAIPKDFKCKIHGPVKGHHLNYFTNDASLKILNKIVEVDL